MPNNILKEFNKIVYFALLYNNCSLTNAHMCNNNYRKGGMRTIMNYNSGKFHKSANNTKPIYVSIVEVTILLFEIIGINRN